jgi:hypothetical protein
MFGISVPWVIRSATEIARATYFLRPVEDCWKESPNVRKSHFNFAPTVLLLIRSDRVVSPLEMSVYKPLRRRAVGMCEITALGDFQGLWEGWETG